MKTDLYSTVLTQARTITYLESILNLLSWDQETMMPPLSNQHRTEQKILLAGIIHDKKQDPHYRENLAILASECSKGEADADIIVRRLHREVSRAAKLPTSFVIKLTQASSEAFFVWQRAKQNNDWELFRPHLTTLVQLMKEQAELLGYEAHPLDPLLDWYEPEATVAKIEALFTPLRHHLATLLEEVQNSPFYLQKTLPLPTTSEEQMRLCTALLSFIGYPWQCSRLDTSEHPFSTAFHPTDSRITIRRESHDLLDQLSSSLHEAGHSMYEMGLPQRYYGTPLCEAASLSIHESQSRFWETIIGQSFAFSTHLARLISTYTSHKNLSPQMVYRQINIVKPSPIRTQADEIAYPLHVILRFTIEKELLEGSLSVEDLPERWNEEMKRSLGIVPKTVAEGCLQDVHWSMGSFGYFPTYTLGSIYAVCFAKAMRQSLPAYDQLIQEGNFSPITTWLSEHVWRHGKAFSSTELVTKALGRPPTEEDYLEYLRNKYCVEQISP